LEEIMKYSMLIGGLAVAIASAGVANAAGVAKGIYQVDGVTSAAGAGCGAFGLGVGAVNHTTIVVPAAGAAAGSMTLTTDQSTPGGAASSVCVSTAIQPSVLIGSTIPFNCGGTPATIAFTPGKANHAKSFSIEDTTSIPAIGCTFTSSSTWVAE